MLAAPKKEPHLRLESFFKQHTTYLVGGAVRDHLLGLPVKDHDWVVVGATPQNMLSANFQQVGADFPVFLHPETHEEYALARTEKKKGVGYQGFECQFSTDVTLEEDLLRRDLTINAIAQTSEGKLIDPYNGQKDIKNRILRHVSPAFREDPLRILRIARFLARFASLGFTIADSTESLMKEMVAEGEVNYLVAERVWQETQRALLEAEPAQYFKTLRACGALKVLMPEIDRLFGVPQRPEYHPEVDTGIHSLMSLSSACCTSNHLAVRFAALTHDVGKALTEQQKWPRHIGHESKGIAPVKALCERFKIPSDCRDLALLAAEYHTHIHRAFELKPATILKLFRSCDALRRPERFCQLLLVAQADSRGRTGFEKIRYPQMDFLSKALEYVKQINIKTLQDKGYKDKALGQAIQGEQLRLLTLFSA